MPQPTDVNDMKNLKINIKKIQQAFSIYIYIYIYILYISTEI
jgi:hypothetical protein